MNYYYGGIDGVKKPRVVSEKAKAALAAFREKVARIKETNPNITHKEAVAMARTGPARERKTSKRRSKAALSEFEAAFEALLPESAAKRKKKIAQDKLIRLALRKLEHPDLKARSNLRLKDYCAPEKRKVTMLEKRLRLLNDKLRKVPVRKAKAARKPRKPRAKKAAVEAVVEAVKGMGYGMMY